VQAEKGSKKPTKSEKQKANKIANKEINSANQQFSEIVASNLSPSKKVDMIIHSTGVTCGIIACQPIPFADIFILAPIQVVMVMHIEKVVTGKKILKKEVSKAMMEIGAVIGMGYAAQQTVLGLYKTILPYMGPLLTVPLVWGATCSIGYVAKYYFESGMNMDPKMAKAKYREAKKIGKAKSKDYSKKKLMETKEFVLNVFGNFGKTLVKAVPRNNILKANKSCKKTQVKTCFDNKILIYNGKKEKQRPPQDATESRLKRIAKKKHKFAIYLDLKNHTCYLYGDKIKMIGMPRKLLTFFLSGDMSNKYTLAEIFKTIWPEVKMREEQQQRNSVMDLMDQMKTNLEATGVLRSEWVKSHRGRNEEKSTWWFNPELKYCIIFQ